MQQVGIRDAKVARGIESEQRAVGVAVHLSRVDGQSFVEPGPLGLHALQGSHGHMQFEYTHERVAHRVVEGKVVSVD